MSEIRPELLYKLRTQEVLSKPTIPLRQNTSIAWRAFIPRGAVWHAAVAKLFLPKVSESMPLNADRFHCITVSLQALNRT